MSQSKKHSHYEITANQVAGIIIGWCLVYFAFPIIGLDTTITQASSSSVMFFISSYIRAYTIRRIFNRIGINMTKEDKEFEDLEKKIGSKTIDIRTSIEEKREWFRKNFDYKADDETIELKWKEQK